VVVTAALGSASETAEGWGKRQIRWWWVPAATLYLIVVGARYGPRASAATVALAAFWLLWPGFEPGDGASMTDVLLKMRVHDRNAALGDLPVV
jgi:hypothetical protein